MLVRIFLVRLIRAIFTSKQVFTIPSLDGQHPTGSARMVMHLMRRLSSHANVSQSGLSVRRLCFARLYYCEQNSSNTTTVAPNALVELIVWVPD
jgi:hypothetical protein